MAELERYTEMLLDWNRTLNLTAARSEKEVAAHIEDAYGLLRVGWEEVAVAVDIGSGGGLPAIPLALRMPQVHFTLIEANARKAAFLQHVAGTLRLPNVAVLSGRAETLAHDSRLREAFDRAISRAAARPAVLLEIAMPFVRAGGDLVAEVGPTDVGRLAGASGKLGGGTPLLQPAVRGYLLTVSKLSPTPARYPRRPGLPAKRPLE